MNFLEDLPIVREFSKFERSWQGQKNFSLKAPTGSGKSIGLPWVLLKNNLVNGRIIVVQPRRIAAVSLARKLSDLINSELGMEVGYHIRFDKRCSETTKVVYVTDGILFRLLCSKQSLSKIGLIIFDEFHERTLQMDASLALAKSIQIEKETDLRIIITSATLDLKKICSYLGDCTPLEITGRVFPVEVLYKKRNDDFIWKQILDETKKMFFKHSGDLLIFLDGASSVSKVAREIQRQDWSKGIVVHRLFGEMSEKEQDVVFEETNRRRIIVATNIAETSLTIPGITMVIDSGLAKIPSFDPNKGINSLFSKKISRSSADQRSGRAGRISSGFCLRLWSETDHQKRPEFQQAEITRLDLSELCLVILAQNYKPESLDWFEMPSHDSLEKARQQLMRLDLIREDDELTSLGLKVSKIPLHPRLSTILCLAESRNCLSEFAWILAILDGKNPFTIHKPSRSKENRKKYNSDLNLLLDKYYCVRKENFSLEYCIQNGINRNRTLSCEKVAMQLCSYFGVKFQPQGIPSEEIAKLLIVLYPEQIVHLKSIGRRLYQDSRGKHMTLSPNSCLSDGSQWAIPLSVTEKQIKGEVKTQMEYLAEVKPEWIIDTLASRIEKVKTSNFDLDLKRVVTETYWALGQHKVGVKTSFEASKQETAHAFAKVISSGQLKLKTWNAEVDQFLHRLSFVEYHCPEYEIKSLRENEKMLVLENFCLGKKNWKEIRNSEILPFILEFVGQSRIETINQIAPSHLFFGNLKKKLIVNYNSNEARVQAKVQDLYDIQLHPKILNETYSVIFEILAPNLRVVQVTNNIHEFWSTSYPELKKQLSGRYPKHEWR